ncbi:MAG: hypothetical protein IJL87_10655 [Clostridia bacterium]|nr:hypothetical protein [Clostridia bacterium]
MSEVFSYTDIPIEFGVALSKNSAAFDIFEGMTDEQRAQAVRGAAGIEETGEMVYYVKELAKQYNL